jgi:hypothetical protein
MSCPGHWLPAANGIHRLIRHAVADAAGDVDRALAVVAEWYEAADDDRRTAFLWALRPWLPDYPATLAREVDRVLAVAPDEASADRMAAERLDRREFPTFRAQVDREVAQLVVQALVSWLQEECLAWRGRGAA